MNLVPFLPGAECIYERNIIFTRNGMYLWTSYNFVHETMYFWTYIQFFVWSRMYLWTSCHFVHETKCIYGLYVILCMKQNVFMNFVSFCAWNKMYLWTLCNFLYEGECIYELRPILCMKQNVFMSLISFLHLTDIISPCSINWLLFVMEIGVLSETPPAYLNIIKPISALQKFHPICIFHCTSLTIFHEQHKL